MKATLFINRGFEFATCLPETLTDGSVVWNIHFKAATFHPESEAKADAAFKLIADAINKANNGDALVL